MFLTFHDQLNKVKVLAPRHPAGSELCIMGVVEGKENLLELLETAAVDYTLFCSGDIFPTPTLKAYEQNPKEIVQELEKVFQEADERPLKTLAKLLQGEQLTDDEKSFRPLTSLHVCSSSVEGVKGLERVHGWFESKKALASPAARV